jgi:hypothetical protein
MRLPQHPMRWIMTVLFLLLVGLTLWIVWAMDKLEAHRAAHHGAAPVPTAPEGPIK